MALEEKLSTDQGEKNRAPQSSPHQQASRAEQAPTNEKGNA